MSNILSKADFMEADVTFGASIELNYLMNVVCFDYSSLRCKNYIYMYTYRLDRLPLKSRKASIFTDSKVLGTHVHVYIHSL